MSRPLLALGLGVVVLAGTVVGCAGDSEPAAEPPPRTVTETVTVEVSPPVPATPQAFPAYEPPDGEAYTNGKRLAGRVAQRLTTFTAGATARDLARSVGADGEAQFAPLVEPTRRSAGEVLYVQLAGVTATTLGTIVVVRQHLEDGDGNRDAVVRAMDIRLRRTDGGWSLDRVGSVGGTPVPRPATLPPGAARVVDHPRIELPDSARWDIYRGLVDDALLRALAEAADRWPLSVTTLKTGHARRVWATERVSAHAAGLAADLYAVGGTLVVHQQNLGSDAHRLVGAFLAGGARQVGSPWILPPGGPRSFTDRVHEDHVHLQQSPPAR